MSAGIVAEPTAPRRSVFAILTLLVVLLALLLRSYNLLSLPIFTDEATYLRWAADILDQRTRMSLFIPVAEDGKQPLFIWLATAAMTFLSDSLLAGRAVSVVAGALGTLGIVLAGYWLADSVVGLLAGFLYAVVPYILVFDRMALADSWVGTAAVWTFALAVFIVNRARGNRPALLAAVALGLVMAAGIWVKSTAVFVLPFPALVVLLLPCLPGSRRRILWSMVAAYGVFASLASLLVLMPYAENQLRLFATHAQIPGAQTVSMPWDGWLAGAVAYADWVQAYLPSPLYWIVLVSGLLALLFHRRNLLLLSCCWLMVVVPATALARSYDSRYVVHSIFPMLLLTALVSRSAGQWAVGSMKGRTGGPPRVTMPAILSLLLIGVVSIPSLAFDLQLVQDPSIAPWPRSDRNEYIEGWPSGYGFNEALGLALASAARKETEVFVLSDHFQGLSHDGLALYIRGIPRVQHFVDGRIAWGEPGIAQAWRSHGVPLIIFRNDGRFKPETFEARVPEAKLIGIFWKPGGRNSYRVYELDPAEIGASR